VRSSSAQLLGSHGVRPRQRPGAHLSQGTEQSDANHCMAARSLARLAARCGQSAFVNLELLLASEAGLCHPLRIARIIRGCPKADMYGKI
jgi:hypothetical protein